MDESPKVFTALAGEIREVRAIADALARLILRVFDIYVTPNDLIAENRHPSQAEIDKSRAAFTLGRELAPRRDDLIKLLKLTDDIDVLINLLAIVKDNRDHLIKLVEIGKKRDELVKVLEWAETQMESEPRDRKSNLALWRSSAAAIGAAVAAALADHYLGLK